VFPPAYIVITYRKIDDPAKWGAYAKIASAAIQKAGGRYLVRGMPAKVYEKGINERVVIVEFDSLAKAQAAHDSPEYKEALNVLGDAVERDMRLVEGVA
jgi:uncharacterized protein (DUF1330 family)